MGSRCSNTHITHVCALDPDKEKTDADVAACASAKVSCSRYDPELLEHVGQLVSALDQNPAAQAHMVLAAVKAVRCAAYANAYDVSGMDNDDMDGYGSDTQDIGGPAFHGQQ